jgi:tetratricopeptide (TPR) repeat protein
LIGLNCFIGFWLVVLYTFWRKSRLMVSGRMRGLACGLGAALVGFLANSVFDFALYLPALAMLVFALAGLLAAIPTADDEEDKFVIPLKAPLAIALTVILCGFSFFLVKSYLASDINNTVNEKRARAFPNEFSIRRGVKPDPALQHAVLRTSVGQLKKSAALFPFSADTYQMLGSTYLKLAEMERAPQLLSESIKYLKRAAELCPVSPYIQHSLAIAYWKQGSVSHQPADFQNALLAELRAANNFPVNPEFHKQLAEIYSALGDSEEAEKEVAQTKKLEKHYREF